MRGRRWVVGVLVLAATTSAEASIYDRFTLGPPTPEEQRTIVASPYAPALTTPIDKFSRGLANVMTGTLELPVTVYTTGRQEGWLLGVTQGLAAGSWRAIVRTFGGAVDALTCLTPPYQHRWIEPPLLFGNQSPVTDAEAR